MATHWKNCLNCFDWRLTAFGYSDFKFKNWREMFLCYSDSSDKNYYKNCYFINFFVSWYLLLNAPIGDLCSSCSNLIWKWRFLWNLLSNAHNLVLPEKSLKSKDFASPTQTFKLLAWAPKIVKTYNIVT